MGVSSALGIHDARADQTSDIVAMSVAHITCTWFWIICSKESESA
jgi:hypothetical protein